MLRASNLMRLACAAWAVFCLGSAPLVWAEVTLQAHEASYDLALHRSSRGGDVVALKGGLEMRFEASCDGWRVEQALGFRLLAQEGISLEHLAHFTSFEEHDGSSFVFNSRTWEDRELVESLSGTVRRRADGALMVHYGLPEEAEDVLPVGSLFPARHVKEVLAAIAAGRRIVLHTVFDGSTAESPYEISSVIGQRARAGAGVPSALVGHSSWPLRLAYFRPGAREPEADFEMSVALYDNGVAGNMIYDYGDFAIDVSVREVRMLPEVQCR